MLEVNWKLEITYHYIEIVVALENLLFSPQIIKGQVVPLGTALSKER